MAAFFGGMNYIFLSGEAEGAATEITDARFGRMAKFPLGLANDGGDGMPVDFAVTILAHGKRAAKIFELVGAGTRMVVHGRITPHEGGVAVYSDWIEFVNVARRRAPQA